MKKFDQRSIYEQLNFDNDFLSMRLRRIFNMNLSHLTKLERNQTRTCFTEKSCLSMRASGTMPQLARVSVDKPKIFSSTKPKVNSKVKFWVWLEIHQLLYPVS